MVVLVPLVAAASVLFINLSVVPPNYRLLYEREAKRRALSDQAHRNSNVALNSTQQDLATLNRQKDELEREKTAESRALQRELEETKNELKDLTTKFNNISSKLTELSINYKDYLARTERLESQLAEEREKFGKKFQENIDLYKLLNQKSTAYERIERNYRVLKEQIEDQKLTIQTLEKKLEDYGGITAGGSRGDKVAVGTDKIIAGEIIAIDEKESLASINVGSAKGVEKGMRLVISRDAEFIGYLRIESVELNSSAGQVEDKEKDPAMGDKVRSKASLLSK